MTSRDGDQAAIAALTDGLLRFLSQNPITLLYPSLLQIPIGIDMDTDWS